MQARRVASIIVVSTLAAVTIAAGKPPAFEFDTALTQARLALDLEHYEEAEQLFEKLASTYPGDASRFSRDYSWVYVVKGYKAFDGDSYAEADALFTRAVEIHPDVAASIIGMRAYARMWAISPALDAAYDNPKTADWAACERLLRDLIAISEADVWAHYRLGGVLERRGKKDDAAAEYRAAIGQGKGQSRGGGKGGARSLDSLRAAAEKASDDVKFRYNAPVHPILSQSDYPDLRKYEDPPFVILSHSDEFSRRAAAVLKDSLSRDVLGGVLTGRKDLPEKCVVYVYRDREDYRKITGSKNSPGFAGNVTEFEGESVQNIRVFQNGYRLLSSTLPHELGHSRTMIEFGSIVALPSWIMEGIAENAARGAPDAEIAVALEKARKEGKLLKGENLLSVVTADERVVALIYPQGHVLTSILVEKYGKDKFLKFMEASSGGRITTAISPQVAGESMKKLQVAKMKEIYGLTPADVDKLMADWIAANLPKATSGEAAAE